MALFVNAHPSHDGRPTKSRSRELSAPESSANESLRIGIVNNMPDAALAATERQILSLLSSSMSGLSFHITLYGLPGIERSASAAAFLRDRYLEIGHLWDHPVDALIVTGAEPVRANLEDEPYWEVFSRLVDYARINTHSTIWSCLGAHAAVLKMSGIRRIRSEQKYCGLFDCTTLGNHPLTLGLPAVFKIPHSRWNDLPEAALASAGYQVLTRGEECGVDTFIMQDQSLFVFFQGHPEYEADTLLREYRRDSARYLNGDSDIRVPPPIGYFNGETYEVLSLLHSSAPPNSKCSLLTEITGILSEQTMADTWLPTARALYGNWLRLVSLRKGAIADASPRRVHRYVQSSFDARRPRRIEQ